MKSDLDALMKAANLDAFVVLGNVESNPDMYYFTGAGHVSNAALFKKAGQPPVLYCNAMERAEAAKSGLRLRLFGSDVIEQMVAQPKPFFTEQGITSGRVAFYGNVDAGSLLALVQQLKKDLPEIEVVGEPKQESIFLRAMETKDADE